METNRKLQGEITEHEKANAALRSAEARLEYLLSNGPVVIYAVKPGETI